MRDDLLRAGFKMALHETDVGFQQGDREADLRADGGVELGIPLIFALAAIKENGCGERDEGGENGCKEGLLKSQGTASFLRREENPCKQKRQCSAVHAIS